MDKKIALIVGSAPCLWDDLDKLESLVNYNKIDVCLVNYAATYFFRENAKYLISLHPDKIDPFRKLRLAKSQEHLVTYSHNPGPGVDFVVDLENCNYGVSGFYAARVMAGIGYKKIIMCGCPNDDTGHYYDDPKLKIMKKVNNNGGSVIRSQIDHYKIELGGKLKSISGLVKDIFGEPTPEWINSEV